MQPGPLSRRLNLLKFLRFFFLLLSLLLEFSRCLIVRFFCFSRSFFPFFFFHGRLIAPAAYWPRRVFVVVFRLDTPGRTALGAAMGQPWGSGCRRALLRARGTRHQLVDPKESAPGGALGAGCGTACGTAAAADAGFRVTAAAAGVASLFGVRTVVLPRARPLFFPCGLACGTLRNAP